MPASIKAVLRHDREVGKEKKRNKTNEKEREKEKKRAKRFHFDEDMNEWEF